MNPLVALLGMLRTAATMLLTSIPLVFLWNGIAVDAISVLKPISYVQAVGLLILATLFQSSFSFIYIRGPAPQAGEIKP